MYVILDLVIIIVIGLEIPWGHALHECLLSMFIKSVY